MPKTTAPVAVRNFDLRAELRATADRRKRPQDAQSVSLAASTPDDIRQIAERMTATFQGIPLDTVQAALSELCRIDPHCSREDLAARAIGVLSEMSSINGTPQALTSFEPRFAGSDKTDSDMSLSDSDRHADDGDDTFDFKLDEQLSELLSLSDGELQPCVVTLISIFERIKVQPDDVRVRRLRRENARFKESVGRHAAAVALLSLAGFQNTNDNDESVLMFSERLEVSPKFATVLHVLCGVAEDCGFATQPIRLQPEVAKAKSSSPSTCVHASSQACRSRDSRRQRVAELTEQRLRDPRSFQEAARKRSFGNRIVAAPRKTNPATSSALPQRRAQHFTMADVERMRIKDEIANMPSYAEEYQRCHHADSVHTYTALVARSYDPELIAKQAVDGTNKYRASKELSPVRWHDGIAKIAQRHAQQMASGAMPFSHDGFDERVRAFPVVHRSAAENLALNSGVADVAKVAVDGWIKSPGHEKNLRGAFNLCGIGVARSANGTFYLTQLFASAM